MRLSCTDCELDHKGGWVTKNWCFWTVVLEKTLESPLDCKEIQAVNPKGNQPWIFIGRTVAEPPILRPPDTKSWLIGNDPDAGKDWRQKDKRAKEDEMVGWHRRLDGHESEQAPGQSGGERAWHATVHRVAKSWTWFSNWTTTMETTTTRMSLFMGRGVCLLQALLQCQNRQKRHLSTVCSFRSDHVLGMFPVNLNNHIQKHFETKVLF